MKSVAFPPPLLPRGSFGGVPARFRGWCQSASFGGNSGGYRSVGYQFGQGLLTFEPHDLEPDEWLTVVHRMDEQLFGGRSRDAIAPEGLGDWLRRHFPLMMRLIPTDRFDRFVEGFVEAHDDGTMMDDFPMSFEPVDVD